MDLIFYNGQKLLEKERQHRQEGLKLLTQNGGIHINHYQKQILDLMFDQNKKPLNVYGDDFKVEITPVNVFDGQCVLSIKDYNKNQKFEKEINVDFNKDELDQFINLLQIAKSKMK